MPAQPTILVCGRDGPAGETARRLRRDIRAVVVTAPDIISAAERLNRRRPAVIVLTADEADDLVTRCRRAKRLHGPHTPVLVVTPPSHRHLGIRCLKEVADSLHVGCVDGAAAAAGRLAGTTDAPSFAAVRRLARLAPSEGPVAWRELAARVQALLRRKRRHDALLRKCNRLERQRQRVEAAHARLDQDLLLARRLQQSFLPRRLPELGAVRFAARFFAVGPVAGDIYDVSRLDEHTLGFYVADAVGHGVAAALLTAFIKKAVRPKVISGNDYRILEPGEVLTALNREMLTEELHESSFVTMAYGTIDVRTHLLRYSLAGHPPAIRVKASGEAQFLDHSGPLLGVMEETYTTQEVELARGDKVVIYSDGIDEARHETGALGHRALYAGVVRHSDLPVDRMLEEALCAVLPGGSPAGLRDDLTLLALEVLPD